MKAMVGGKKVYEAIAKGDVKTFEGLLREDPYLLDTKKKVNIPCIQDSPPLHTATMQGNAAIAGEMVWRNPRLATELDWSRLSALHIAAEKGDVETASMLVAKAPNMCLVRDPHGKNPIHIAAEKGDVEMLECLIQADHDHIPAWERVGLRGHTVLHLCAKHGRLRALDFLLRKLGADLAFVEDLKGDTILHTAVQTKQLEVVGYLLENSKMEVQLRKFMGKAAVEILRNNKLGCTETRRILEKGSLLTDEEKAEYSSQHKDLLFVYLMAFVFITTVAFQLATQLSALILGVPFLLFTICARSLHLFTINPNTYGKRDYFTNPDVGLFLFFAATYLLFLTTAQTVAYVLSEHDSTNRI